MFASIGGSGTSHFFLFKRYVPTAPISVATLPKITSQITPPAIMFEIRHPIKSPGIAAGVNAGRIVSASENLTCITPLESPIREEIVVKTT